jgi:hypothetical protein
MSEEVFAQEPVEEATLTKIDRSFDTELVTKYPRSNRKISLEVRPYGLVHEQRPSSPEDKGQSVHISPHGIEFQGMREYPEGTLLKINVELPDYWARKQKFVEYSRIDSPGQFRVLAKVIRTEEIGKRGKKKKVIVQTVNIDEVDEKVLKSFLQEAK